MEQSALVVLESAYPRIPPTLNPQDNTLNSRQIIHVGAPSHAEEVSLAKRYSLRGDNNDKLRLIHHYAISTCYSSWNATSVTQSVHLRDIVPALGFEHDFLLSGLLAVSSLHLALLNPSDINIASAIKYHTEALRQVQPHLMNVSPNNVGALFSFSCLIASYSFGFHQIQTPSNNSLKSILEVFTLIRGIRVIVRDGMQWLKKGPFAQSLSINPSNPNASLEPKLEAALSKLLQRTSEHKSDPKSRDVYTAAIALLRQNFILASEKPGVKMTALPFPILVSDIFLESLKGEDPLALVIFANYAVLLHWLRGYVWLRGWGKQIVQAVNHIVGTEWSDCLEGAMQEISISDIMLKRKEPLEIMEA